MNKTDLIYKVADINRLPKSVAGNIINAAETDEEFTTLYEKFFIGD